jgi:hypothetical protein
MTASLFVALVLVVALMAVRVLRRAGASILLIVVLALIDLVIPAILAQFGMLDRYTPLPPPVLLMIGIIAIVTLIVTLSPLGMRIIAVVGLPALVGFQVFRIPVEWLLHRLYEEGIVPVQMTYAGRNFDIISGVTAGVLGLWLMRERFAPSRVSKTIVLTWNVLGLMLLANVVTIAVLSTPVPFRMFLEEPANLLPSRFPYLWLPTFLVQMALAGHVLVFRRMLRER